MREFVLFKNRTRKKVNREAFMNETRIILDHNNIQIFYYINENSSTFNKRQFRNFKCQRIKYHGRINMLTRCLLRESMYVLKIYKYVTL